MTFHYWDFVHMILSYRKFLGVFYSLILPILTPISALGQSHPEIILEFKETGNCEELREYLVSNDLSQFHYRSCMAQHRSEYIAQALNSLDCEAVKRLIPADAGQTPMFICRARLASSTENFNIHWQSISEQRRLYAANMMTAEEFLEIAGEIHSAAEQTGDIDLISYSEQHLGDTITSLQTIIDREQEERVAQAIEDAHQQYLENAAVEIRHAWQNTTTFFEDRTGNGPNYLTETNFLHLGQNLCEIEIEKQITAYRKTDDVWAISSVAIWRIDLSEYMQAVLSDEDSYAFSGFSSDRISFWEDAGVDLERCTTEVNTGYDAVQFSCNDTPLFQVDPDDREALQDKFFSLMFACHQRSQIQ